MADRIQKAEQIIERFGGIRPMAAKMGVPVTTVQGWKKRDAIPENRIEEIMTVARSHNINLSDLIVTGAVGTPAQAQASDPSVEDTARGEAVADSASTGDAQVSADQKEDAKTTEAPRTQAAFSSIPKIPGASSSGADVKRPDARTVGKRPAAGSERETEVRAVKTSSLVSIILILLVAMGSASYLWPMLREHNERITHVETQVDDLRGDVAEVREDQKALESAPATWSERLAEIERQAEEAKKIAEGAMNTAIHEVSAVQGELMQGNVSGLYKKAQDFDQYVTDMTAKSPAMQGFVNALDSLLDEEKGRQTISEAVSALGVAFGSFTGETQASTEEAIERARQSDPAAAAVFEGVPKEDLKAAGVMFSLSQLRASLGQEGKPFDQDLGLLKNMVGHEDPELRAAIEQTEPKAKHGVFSSATLARMFDSASEDVVDSSLQGEGVTLAEQAKARLNSLVQIEKDGELITGTDTQATFNKAKRLLAQGDVRGARQAVDTLPDSEKSQLKDWIEKADATIQVQDLSVMLDRNLSSIIGIDDFLSSYYITRQTQGLR